MRARSGRRLIRSAYMRHITPIGRPRGRKMVRWSFYCSQPAFGTRHSVLGNRPFPMGHSAARPWSWAAGSSADCRVPSAECRMLSADCRLPTAEYRLPFRNHESVTVVTDCLHAHHSPTAHAPPIVGLTRAHSYRPRTLPVMGVIASENNGILCSAGCCHSYPFICSRRSRSRNLACGRGQRWRRHAQN